MDVPREDLVAYALGGLPAEETPRLAAAIASNPALARELKQIERHLRLHERAPRIAPSPALWDGIRERLDEPAAPRSLLHRFRLPLAAAALMALAFLWPQQDPSARPATLFGEVLERPDGAIAATGVARVRMPDGVTITLDHLLHHTSGLPDYLGLLAADGAHEADWTTAADALQQMGYRRVRSLAGGYRAWIEAGLPVEKP